MMLSVASEWQEIPSIARFLSKHSHLLYRGENWDEHGQEKNYLQDPSGLCTNFPEDLTMIMIMTMIN